jgi:Cof subfamily protein (haloacid dehalogenase superfamily)
MIRALILDIDGVIVGNKPGYNFPNPHPDVIAALRAIEEHGLPVSLCTAKPAFSIQAIIDTAGLRNPHITNGGAAIIDPISDQVIAEHSIEKTLARDVALFALEHKLYIELYTSDDCYILRSQASELTRKHAEVEQRYPQLVNDIGSFLAEHDVVKIFFVTKDEPEKQHFSEVFLQAFEDKITFSWTIHPTLLPCQLGVVTALGVSKAHGAREVAKSTGIELADTLGVGDTLHDWQFIELCGYGGAMGNASEDLKKLVTSKGAKSFIGSSVDENGILSILHHFNLVLGPA